MPQFSAAQGAITKDSLVDAVDKSIDTLWLRRNEFIGALAPFFDVDKKSGGLSHVISSVGSALPLPTENEDTDSLPYFQPAAGFKKTFTTVNYRSGIRVTDTMLAADRFDVIVNTAAGQMKSGFRKDEYLRASIFNNAFTGSGGADGENLCSNSHPNEAGETGTWDNLGAAALDAGTGSDHLQALRLLAAQMTDEQGDPDPVSPKWLLVPTELQQVALELTAFGDAPRTAPGGSNNDPNVLVNELVVITSPYLTSVDAYFLIGDRAGPSKGLHEIALQDWNIADNAPANADIKIDKRIKAIKTYGFTTCRNVIGSPV
jgi:hypothetical protein